MSTSTQAKLLRAQRQRRVIVGLTWGFSIVSFAVTLVLLNWIDRGADANREAPGVFSASIAAIPVSGEARPVFRHSIVPGGVRSREEVVEAMAKDVVVKAHYSAVKPAALRQVQLSSPLKVHVSYRIRNNVYWTKRPLTVAAGEFVLTDGTVTIRERCGNLLSIQPLGPTQAVEPDSDEFDMRLQPLAPSSQSVAVGSPKSGGSPGSIPDVAVATQFRLAPSATEFGSPGGQFGGGPPPTNKVPSSSGNGTPTTNSVDEPPPTDAGSPPANPPSPPGPPTGEPGPPGGDPRLGDPGPPGSDPPVIKIQDGPGDPDDPNNHVQDVPLPVPEPATWTLVGIGLAAAGLRRYLKKPRARS